MMAERLPGNLLRRVALGLCLFLALGATARAESYAVIVNAQNSFMADELSSKQLVKNLFLRLMESWPSGVRARPLARHSSSSEHSALLSRVLNMTEPELALHWLTLKQKNGKTPPRVVKSTRILFKLVGKDQGAFAVVEQAALTRLPSDVRVLLKF